MKIYFAGSIAGGRRDVKIYKQIIQIIKIYGTVLTEHIGELNIDHLGESKVKDKDIFYRDRKWLNSADVLLAEVSTPSLGVGYEIGIAEAQRKPILCLYKKSIDKRLSAMIKGNNYIKFNEYQDINNIKDILKKYFSLL